MGHQMKIKLGFKPRSWSDHDHYLGPFTFAFGDYWRTIALVLSSTDEDGRGCNFRISIGTFTLIIALPNWLLKPEAKKVFAGWDETTIRRLGRDYYWDITRREYGFSLGDGFLDVHFGRVTHDSSTEQRWGYFLSWTQWRHVRHSLYALDGRLFADLSQGARFDDPRRDADDALSAACPKRLFNFYDYDGQHLVATTLIQEMEWKFGDGLFKWLSLFIPNKVRRYLDIRFSRETGRQKGSWKGGTIGHSIDMLPGELHEEAFKRYCSEHEMTFINAVAPPPPSIDPNAAAQAAHKTYVTTLDI